VTSVISSAAAPWQERRLLVVALRLLGQVLEFLAWVVLARRLPAEVLGELTVAFLACRYGGLLADWGARYSGMRHVAAGLPLAGLRPLLRRRRHLSAVLGVVFLIWALGTGTAVLLPLLAVLLQQGLNRDWISLGQRRMFVAGFPALLQGGVLLLLVAVLPAHPFPIALALGVAYATALVVSLRVNPSPSAEPGPTAAARVPGWMVVAVLADQALATLDVFLLALLASSADAGMYAAVYRLPNAWLAVVGLISASSIPAAAASLSADPTAVHQRRGRLLRRGLAAGGLTLTGVPLVFLTVPALFGEDYARAAAAAAVLVGASAVVTLTAFLIPSYLSVVPDGRYARAQLSAAGINLGLNLLLIPDLGMLGAAIATLVAQLVLFTLVWWSLSRVGGRASLPAAGERAAQRAEAASCSG
jgi:O-antigen/teichoic acid export membrane protein